MSLAGQLPSVKNAADIGCDHGYVAAELVLRGCAQKVFAVDISPVSVAKAQSYADLAGLGTDKVEVSQGDGFVGLEGKDITLGVITGLGGYKIISILGGLPNGCDHLILGPQKDAYVLRKYLLSQGFELVSDFTVKDERYYYDLMYARRHGGVMQQLDEIQLLYGLTDIKSPSKVFWDRLAKDRARLSRIKSEGLPSDGVSNQRRLEVIELIYSNKRPL